MRVKKMLLFAFALVGIGYGTLQLLAPSASVKAAGCCWVGGDGNCSLGLGCVWRQTDCSDLNKGYCE